MPSPPIEPSVLWTQQEGAWRDPADVVAFGGAAGEIDPRCLEAEVHGAWWEVLAAHRVTLLLTREYEHLVVALGAPPQGQAPAVSFMRVPHPSGLAVDPTTHTVHLASTRNPNQVFDLAPATGLLRRPDVRPASSGRDWRPLIPIRSRYLPGSLYLHDLALVGNRLYANSVGQNAVVELSGDASYRVAWWPRCIDGADGPILHLNYIQLNSIAAGNSLETSFYSASGDRLSRRRPGHRNYPVDRRGVIFSGATREPVARGLTRPHSARLHRGQVWVDNSGYGTLVVVDRGRSEEISRLPGWTRGLCLLDDLALVGTSRVIPRFSQYAPGLDVQKSVCGIHAVDIRTGAVLGSIVWPYGNQIFAIVALPEDFTSGLPFSLARREQPRETRTLFYAFRTDTDDGVCSSTSARRPTCRRIAPRGDDADHVQ